MSSLSPLTIQRDERMAPRVLDHMFSSAFAPQVLGRACVRDSSFFLRVIRPFHTPCPRPHPPHPTPPTPFVVVLFTTFSNERVKDPIFSLQDLKREWTGIPSKRAMTGHPIPLLVMFVTFQAQLVRSDPRRRTILACALLVRGRNVEISDIKRNVAKLQVLGRGGEKRGGDECLCLPSFAADDRPPNPLLSLKGQLKMVHWNQEGFKVGLCGVPAVGDSRVQQVVVLIPSVPFWSFLFFFKEL